MAARDRAAKAGRTARDVAENAYVQRLVEDAELRAQILDAFDSAKKAYGRMSNGKGPLSRALMEDKKLQRELRESATNLREAANALREAPKRRKRRFPLGRTIVIALVGGTIAMVASESFRAKVLDALFGKEEEFEYTPSTTPAPAPDAVTA